MLAYALLMTTLLAADPKDLIKYMHLMAAGRSVPRWAAVDLRDALVVALLIVVRVDRTDSLDNAVALPVAVRCADLLDAVIVEILVNVVLSMSGQIAATHVGLVAAAQKVAVAGTAVLVAEWDVLIAALGVVLIWWEDVATKMWG